MKRIFIAMLLAGAGAPAAIGAQPNDPWLMNETDGTNWASYGRTFSENHFSPLKQINDKNVERLGLVWAYDLPVVSSVFSAPLAVDGVLYFAVGHSVIHALDAKSGKLLWQFDPEVPKAAGLKLRPFWGLRGIAFYDGAVYAGTMDGRLLAIDARTGNLLWSVQTTEPDDFRVITGPPWVFNGKVAIGHGGADFGVRGYVTAYDAKTGKQVWRFYTVPGDPSKGPDGAASDSVMPMAAKTWTGEWWKFGGGGTVWNAMAYDPKFNRLYLGTGNGSPWNHKIRSPGGGDNLFLASILALDADTGEYAWHYQVNPGESWDYNASMDIQLAELKIRGKKRSVLMHAPKNGFFYVIDRKDGKLISAEKFARVNWAERIDLKTGRPVENPEARYADKPFLMFPGPTGAHNVAAMSFNPITKLVYIPKTELGMVYSNPPGDLSAWKPQGRFLVNAGIGGDVGTITVPNGSSALLAWDPVKQKAVWEAPLKGIQNGGTATTAGNLVFQGTVTGEFIAYAADSGKVLWSFDAQAGVATQPITYTVEGKQYVTVIAGWRGIGSASGINPEWDYYTQKRRVLTFALDGSAQLPPADYTVRPFVDDAEFLVDPAKAALGRDTYEPRCFVCHGGGMVSGGTAPDLRKATLPLSIDALTSVLRGGALESRGMPRFEELTDQQIEGIQHYIRDRARAAIAEDKQPSDPEARKMSASGGLEP